MQATASSSLPAPDATSAAHSQRCAEFIRAQIATAGGSLSFAEFMHLALYAPGLGYYAAGSTKFGAAGDFVTAPEVSPLFGRVLARRCAAVLEELGGASVLEFGAGSGRLAVDVLKALAELGALPDEYRILEVSAELAERQSSRLEAEIPELVERVRWIARPPERHRGVVIANEVLDALPVERFVRRGAVRQQRVVVADKDAFAIVEADAPRALRDAVEQIELDLGRVLPDGFVSEVSLAAPAWVSDVMTRLTAGAAFLFDYGLSRREYYADTRSGGWLRCHFRHHAHDDPLILAGIQDITSWVDFTAAAAAAVNAGADVAAYVNQAMFLLGGGLEREFENFSTLPQASQRELSAQVKMLTLPGEMGEHFKCLVLSKGPVSPATALRSADRTHTL